MAVCPKNKMQAVKAVVFAFVTSLFFARESNVFIFYIAFVLYFSLTAVYVATGALKLVRIDFPLNSYLIFACFSAVSITWAENQQWASEMTVRLFLVCVILLMLNISAFNFDLRKSVFYGLIVGVFFNFALLISPLAFHMTGEGRFSGTFGNPNSLAMVCLFFMYFSEKLKSLIMWKKSHFIYYASILFSITLIVSTGSRKGLLFGLALLLLIILRGSKDSVIFKVRSIIILLGISSVLFYLALNFEVLQKKYIILERLSGFIDFVGGDEGDTSTKWRMKFIEEGWNAFLEKPLFGIGIHNFQTLYEEGLYAHNNYIELLVDLGIIGFGLYYFIFLRVMLSLVKSKDRLLDYGFLVVILVMDNAMVSYFERIHWVMVWFFIQTYKYQTERYQDSLMKRNKSVMWISIRDKISVGQRSKI